MTIGGFSFVRSGIEFSFPFIEAIKSILPICDEFVIVVGDCTDGTREAIEKINSSKIKIIDSIWDLSLREGGKILAQQTNLALDELKTDWCFYIQGDEVIHENDLPKILEAVKKFDADKNVEGLLFPWFHFWGSYHYIRTSRKAYRHEVRVFRNIKCVRSYKDAQGFRKYSSKENYERGEEGEKLKVKKVDAHVFHYGYARPPKVMKKKDSFFHQLWHNDEWLKKNVSEKENYEFEKIDRLEKFTGSHPTIMMPLVNAQDWKFEFNKKLSNEKTKDKFLRFIENISGIRIGEYKNYILLK